MIEPLDYHVLPNGSLPSRARPCQELLGAKHITACPDSIGLRARIASSRNITKTLPTD